MPNTYIKAEKFVSLALALLERDSVLPNVLTRIDGGAFVGAKADVLHHRLPGITRARDYEFRTRTAPIVYDEIYRTLISIALNTHTTAGNAVTDEEMLLDVENFAVEVVQPMLEALRTKLERKVVKALDNAGFKHEDVDFTASGTGKQDAYQYALKMRRTLNDQGTPKTGRMLLIGNDVETFFLENEKMVKMDPSQAPSAFREATIGRIAGFDVVVNDLVEEDAIFGLHQSWGILANVAPPVEQGMTYAARRRYKDYDLRVVRGFDMNYARHQTLLSTFTGISSVKDEYQRYTAAQEDAATAANAEVGDIIFGENDEGDTVPLMTGKNVRGARGTLVLA